MGIMIYTKVVSRKTPEVADTLIVLASFKLCWVTLGYVMCCFPAINKKTYKQICLNL